MNYRMLGKTKMNVSVIGFGGGAISGEGKGYGFGSISEADAISLLLESFDFGINFFDTAPIYGFGLSEKRMGKAFTQIRDKVFLVSKCGVTWHANGRVNLSNHPDVAIKMLEQSLRDLKSDYIDLYMIHWPDPQVDVRKTMEVLAKAKRQGKIKHIGLCNFLPPEIDLALEIEEVDVLQSEFNILKRESSENLFGYLKSKEMGFMSYGTLGKGVITGRVTKERTFDQWDARSWAPWWKKSYLKDQIENTQVVLAELAKYGHNGLELALAHNLAHSEITSSLCGIRNSQQLDSINKALDNLPSKNLIDQAISIYES